jgi:hypothetical protein
MTTTSQSKPTERTFARGGRRAARKGDAGGANRARHAARRGHPEQSVGLETVGAFWWSALDAAESALFAAGGALPAMERRERFVRLSSERASTVKLLEDVARAARVRVRFSHLLARRT